MASSTLSILLLTILFCSAFAQRPNRAPFKPNSLILPTRKDAATSLHVTHIRKRTPRISIPFLVDVNGGLLWVACDQNYTSSTYNAPICHSSQCSRAGVHYCHKCPSPVRPGCHNNTCGVIATNPFTRRNAISELAMDAVSIQSTEGSRWATTRHFLFACSPSSLLQGPLPQGVRGVAGLGHTPIALPLQLASHFGFQPQFSMCLSRSEQDNGAIFFGNIPTNILAGNLTYTPLTIGADGEYHVLVSSIRINSVVPFNTSLLSTTRFNAGTTISTTSPYTVMHHSIYQTFTQFFANQTTGVPRAQAISPFGLCFNSTMLPPGPAGIPNIEFVFQNRNIAWTIYGYDALVQVRPNVSCLAFVDGGSNTRAPITIGAYQLENSLFHFDFVRSRFGFMSSNLTQNLSENVNCSSFNITTQPELPLEFLDEIED